MTRRYANRVKRGATPGERILHHRAVTPTGCWELRLALDEYTGYGVISIDGRVLKAHRVSYEAFVGPIPDGLEIDHLCRNRACCNPAHLEPVTSRENNLRSPHCGAHRTHCPHGHEYTEANTYTADTNRRYCRTCNRVKQRLWHSITPEERAARKAAGLPVLDLAAYFALERVA